MYFYLTYFLEIVIETASCSQYPFPHSSVIAESWFFACHLEVHLKDWILYTPLQTTHDHITKFWPKRYKHTWCVEFQRLLSFLHLVVWNGNIRAVSLATGSWISLLKILRQQEARSLCPWWPWSCYLFKDCLLSESFYEIYKLLYYSRCYFYYCLYIQLCSILTLFFKYLPLIIYFNFLYFTLFLSKIFQNLLTKGSKNSNKVELPFYFQNIFY